MTRLLGIICFAIAVLFYALSVNHGHITYILFMLLGLFLVSLGSYERWPW